MTEEKIEICIGRRSGKTYNMIQEMAKEIDRLQKELDKKDKVIDLMAGDLFLKDDLSEYDENCIEDIKEYFYKQVEVEDDK